jgi:hypothetical protein
VKGRESAEGAGRGMLAGTVMATGAGIATRMILPRAAQVAAAARRRVGAGSRSIVMTASWRARATALDLQ